MPLSNRKAQNLPSLRIVWFSFITSHLLFAGLILSGVLITSPASPTAEEPETLPLILSAFGVLSLFMAHALRYLIYFKAKPQLPIEQRLPRYMTASLVAFAFADSTTIFGFIIAFLTRISWYVLPFAALGLLCHLTLYPKQAHLDD